MSVILNFPLTILALFWTLPTATEMIIYNLRYSNNGQALCLLSKLQGSLSTQALLIASKWKLCSDQHALTFYIRPSEHSSTSQIRLWGDERVSVHREIGLRQCLNMLFFPRSDCVYLISLSAPDAGTYGCVQLTSYFIVCVICKVLASRLVL